MNKTFATILSGALSGTLLAASAAHAFQATEHKRLGDEAYVAAIKKFTSERGKFGLSDAQRLNWSGPGTIYAGTVDPKGEVGYLTFGDLVSIYGDMVASYEELNRPQSKALIAEWRDVARTDNLSRNKDVNRREMELAYVNETHFAGKAVDAYVAWHQKALDGAAQGGKNGLWSSLHYEALALHSFTDLYAVGHMMIDRDATMKLLAAAKAEDKVGYALIDDGIKQFFEANIDLLKGATDEVKGKYLLGFYANFYHNGFNYWGAKVSNLNGQTWQAYGDHRLKDSPQHEQIIVTAAAESIDQVLQTAVGKPPAANNRFMALRYLPVRFTNAACSVSLQQEQKTVLNALIKENTKIMNDGGIDASLLKKQKVADGTVAYLAEIKKYCGPSCAGK
ncbi:MAG: hypothetical protein JST92_09010 [Deltaproteobacteria bacterium]|nr:hypothetical protein [Deltaproteobacteria bacterium]